MTTQKATADYPLGEAARYVALASKWEGQAKTLQGVGEVMSKFDWATGQVCCRCAEIYQACATELMQHTGGLKNNAD